MLQKNVLQHNYTFCFLYYQLQEESNANDFAADLYALAEQASAASCEESSSTPNIPASQEGDMDCSAPSAGSDSSQQTTSSQHMDFTPTSPTRTHMNRSSYCSKTTAGGISPNISSSNEARNSPSGPDKTRGQDEDMWTDYEDVDNVAREMFDSHKDTCNVEPKYETELHDLLVSLCNWQIKHNVSESGLTELFNLIKPLLDDKVADKFPKSLHTLYKRLGIDQDNFTKYIVCPECTQIYSYKDVLTTNTAGRTKVTTCTNKLYDKGKFSKPCNTELVKEVLVKKKKVYVPIKYYCYKSVINSLEEMLKRPGVVKQCKEWCERDVPEGVYSDIYDGHIWKNFWKSKKRPEGFFSANEHTYGFSLNIDWYQPYKHRSDVSIGVIYLVLLNLPREERYKRENWVVVGVIPNLKKEPSSLKYFLRPLVEELKKLCDGIKVETSDHPHGLNIRAALVLVTCDIPAARKTCGFLGHSAKLGCSKCLKQFKGTVGNMDYSGYDVQNWPKRTVTGHRAAVKTMQSNAQSKSSAKALESKCGYRYTPLLDLAYFDTVQFCTIDAMHNLFTGIGKHICGHLWIKKLELFTREDLEKIDERLERLSNANENGWRPKCFSSNWSSWTAYEFKSWILTYSLYALQGILEEKHMNVWHTFVLACRRLVQPTVTKADIEVGYQLLVKFVKQVQAVYGPDVVTPNMHMSMHIRNDMLNYGSLYATWLFAFERCNFVMGCTKTNKKNIEVQLMRSVEKYKQLVSMTKPPAKAKVVSTKYHSLWPLLCPLGNQSVCEPLWVDLHDITLPREATYSLDSEKQHSLHQCYRAMYPDKNIQLPQILLVCASYGHIHMSTTKYASCVYSRSSKKYGGVLASWNDGQSNVSFESEVRPCKIVRFIKHSLRNTVTGGNEQHIFAIVKWYRPYPEASRYLSPISVWESKKFVNFGPASFVPVQRISSKFVWTIHNAGRLVIAPVPAKINL